MYKLRTKPTQFTKGKTEETLRDLTQRYLLNMNETDYHLIDIIVTNKSLPETEQWKIRTDRAFNSFPNITIDILSSKSADYNNIGSYIHSILNCKSKEQLPNILIVCFHEKRVCKDLVGLFSIFGGHNYIKPAQKIKFHVSFDEPDANIGVTKKFIKKMKAFIDDSVITGVLFITATPIDEFWRVLNESGIKTLLNMNHGNTQNFDEELDNYRAFKDHRVVEHNNETNNPLHYISDVFARGLIDEAARKIVFAPAHQYTEAEGVGSHSEVVSFFAAKNYCVLVMNGKFKGFINPNGDRVDLERFNLENGVRGELRESLVKWNELNPAANLAITGYHVIERGITFNTVGFNFTDMILSNYHLSSTGKLIQLAGRGSGGKTYVGKMNVVCTTNIKEQILAFNQNLEKICSLNPQYFNKSDFQNTNNTIPVKVLFADAELLKSVIGLCSNPKRGYKLQVHRALLQGL